MTNRAYLRLLEKAVMTVNAFSPNPFWTGKHILTLEERVEFIWGRLRSKDYSKEYIRQLVEEDIRGE